MIASPFNPRLKPGELEYVIRYSEAKALFVGPEFLEIAESLRPRLPKVRHFISLEGAAPGMSEHQDLLETTSSEEPQVSVDEDDPVCIIYTSGTTGLPRGALYTHRRLMEDTKQLIMDLDLQQGETHVQITPLFHIAGNAFFRAFLCTGGCNVIMKSFDPKVHPAGHPGRASHPHDVRPHPVGGHSQPSRPGHDMISAP